MKIKISGVLFAFGIISTGIAVYQFSIGHTTGAVLSLIYLVMFFTGGILYRRTERSAKNEPNN